MLFLGKEDFSTSVERLFMNTREGMCPSWKRDLFCTVTDSALSLRYSEQWFIALVQALRSPEHSKARWLREWPENWYKVGHQ